MVRSRCFIRWSLPYWFLMLMLILVYHFPVVSSASVSSLLNCLFYSEHLNTKRYVKSTDDVSIRYAPEEHRHSVDPYSTVFPGEKRQSLCHSRRGFGRGDETPRTGQTAQPPPQSVDQYAVSGWRLICTPFTHARRVSHVYRSL